MEDFMSRKDSAEAERRWLREQEKFPWRKNGHNQNYCNKKLRCYQVILLKLIVILILLDKNRI